MRKFLTLIAGTMITGTLLAGGLVTNTNQSAAWVRMPARNASLEVDAAYYNPAGLMKLENGFHVSLSNQMIWQSRTITSSYPFLNDLVDGVRTYEGSVTALLFPSIYAVYKLDKVAFSLGVMPIGGGGGATYENGLPSFETSLYDFVPALASQGATGYDADIFFEGSSVFMGYQGAVSYKINDIISVAVGARYVSAKNTYSGYMKNIMVNFGSFAIPAVDVFDGIVDNLNGIMGIPSALQGAIDLGFGAATLQNLVDAGQMTAPEKSAIEEGLVYIGVPEAALPTLTLNVISGTVTAATPVLTATRNQAAATSTLVDDKSADVIQKGSGVAPFFSINLSPTENLNIAIKYEMATKLELINETKEDLLVGYTAAGLPITKFPNDVRTRNDMPAMLSVGAQYSGDKVSLAAGMNYYFDKDANYGHTYDADLRSSTDKPVAYDNSEIIASNGFAVQAGFEYDITDNLLVSAGYAWANKGVNSKYQSDLTFANATNTVGLGGAYNINERFKINLGAAYTMYQKDEKILGRFIGTVPVTSWETYKKDTFMVGIGVDLKF